MYSFDLTFHAGHGLAFLLVIFYAWSRFNTPKTVRSQTSRSQYFASGATYVLSCVGLWSRSRWRSRKILNGLRYCIRPPH